MTWFSTCRQGQCHEVVILYMCYDVEWTLFLIIDGFVRIFKVHFSNTALCAAPQIQMCRRVGGWLDWTFPLAAKRSNHLDLIHTRLDLIHYSARFHPLLELISSTTRQDLIYTRLDLIHYSARSHPLLELISSTTRLDLISHPLLGLSSSLITGADMVGKNPVLNFVYSMKLIPSCAKENSVATHTPASGMKKM